MTVPPQTAGALSKSEKQEMLRRILVERISQARTEPASFAQERLWFLDRMLNAGAAYNLPRALRLSGPLDSLALERALRETVRRHESLRTTFAEQDGAPVQVIAPFTGFLLPMEDLSALAPAEREAEVRRRAADDAAQPFDLAQGPLFRARLLRLAADEHVLLLCMHHIVTDAWSMGVLLREVAALYAGYRQGGEPALPELPLQYADYAAEQRERLRGTALDGELAWWRERLAGAPALLELPADRPRPAAQTYRGAAERVAIPAAVVERLHAVARAEGATLYMVLLGAFQLLLSRYAGTDDVVVGSPIAGRTRAEVEGLIGFFVNTLVMRTDLSGDPSFREVVRRVRATTLGAYAHQEVPFERLVAELQPERSLGHHPLFQAMFTLDEVERGEDGFAGVRVSHVEADVATSKFDLLLALAPENGGLAGEMVYASDLFDGGTVRRMLEHLGRVLEQVAADAEAPVSRIDLLRPAERALVLSEWNRTLAAYPADATVHRLFAQQAARTPDAVAVVFEDETLSYGELDARANRLANHLVRLGVGPEARVGLSLERGPQMAVAILAILKAGGAYVPLDPAYPRERLAFMLADSAVQVLLTQESLRAALPADGITVVSIDREAERIAAESAEDPRMESGAHGLAYVIYTSGSTGTPKGVAVEHRAILRLVRGANYVHLGPDETILQAAPVSFDASTLEIWGALLNGGRMVLMPGANPTLEELGRALVRHGVTTLWLTAGLFQVMVQERLEDLRGVRQLLAGGDVLPVDAVAKVRRRFPALRLINGYGPTENTTFTCCHTVDAEWSGGPVPIGSPISNTRVYVLDGAMRPVPIGVAGELYAGGDGVARGYLGRAALTAEKFVPDPFGSRPGARLYRTGDRVRWRANGTVEYLGRLDEQVKVRGFRIELGEIETALRAHPGVQDCVVIARGDQAADRRVAAYVVGDATADALRAHLRRTLPEHMLPGAYVFLDYLPLTPNGKVDRRALPAPEAATDAERYAAPRTPTEEVLASIWAEVLRRERVGVHDDFFALGGHSLLVTRVISRIRTAFGIELSVRAVFEAPTLELLAAKVEAAREDGESSAAEFIPRADGRLPVSFQQRQLWLLDRVQPGTTLYNVPAAWHVRGPLDAVALARALNAVVRRHEPLRTVFRAEGGDAVQVVRDDVSIPLPVEDLSGLAAEAREREVQTRIRRNGSTHFNLEHGPLVHAELLRLGEDDHLLLLCLHHVVCDGWSLGVLFRELAALYADENAVLPPLPVRYADYAAWQRSTMAGERLERHMAWWREHLSGAPTLLTLPTDRPRPAEQSYRGAVHHFALPAALAERLEALARREGASLYMVLLPAFQVLLGRYARQDEVVVGSPVANRPRPELEGLVGYFANAMALRTDLRGDPAFREVLARVRETTLDAYAHQAVPFERLVEELQPERSLGHNPVFQAFFALHDSDGDDLRFPGLTVDALPGSGATAKFDVSLHLVRTPDSFEGTFEYATDLFDASTIQRMAAHLTVLLDAVAEHPERRLSALPVITPLERETLVSGWSGAGESFPVDGSLHGRFEAQAAARPDAVAVTFEGQSLSYGQLNARANRLARRLRALGVGPESRVGLAAERSLELVVGVMAILKAGAAYVPLDPAYPAERLSYMAEDSGIRVLLAQSAVRDRVPVDGVPVIALEEDVVDEIGEDLGISVDPSNLAYVIYTSGSTGRPKGVGVTHGNVLRLFSCTESGFGFTDKDVWTLFHSYAFDFSVWEIWGALLYGGRLVVVPFDVSRDPIAFRALLERERVTSLSQTPSAFKALTKVDEESLNELSTLRYVVFGGEALQYESLRTWLERYGPKRPRLVNMYGITETTVHVTWHTVTGAELKPGAVGSSVGKAIPDLRAYVLDPAGNPAPIGVPGELFVGGAGLARGYLGRPGLTAQRFVPDPFSGDEGARLYRSGDLARWRVDGTLEYLGRIDQQVKVRGFRIELGEIESVLLAQPGVSAAAVIVRGEGEEAALVGYFVAAGEAPAQSVLRDALKAKLPDYMVPAAFVAIDRIPLTSNGKLDRKALPEPDMAGDDGADSYVAPRTPVEEVLAGIWGEVLGARRVGVDDNFFELGGHSLLATLVMARVREVLGVGVPLRTLFERPTVGQLAERVEALRRKGEPQLPPVVPVDRDAPVPLTFAQERLWFLQRLQPESTPYNHLQALRLHGTLDERALERALGEIVRRHEPLRTTFPEMNGGPVQVVRPFTGFDLPVVDLSALPEAERQAQVERHAAAQVALPFDFAHGPIFRTQLLRVDTKEHVLLMCVHHIVTDGWSTAILYRELSTLYAAYRDGRDAALPDHAIHFGDFAAWQRGQLRGEAMDRQLAYWRQKLAGAPTLLNLPTDRPRPAVQSYRGGSHRFTLPARLAESLEQMQQKEGATLYMVLLAAFQVLLGKYAGTEDVVVGSPIAGRTQREVEGLIGFFVNTLVLRTDLSGDPTFHDLLRRVREGTLGAYEHQDAPFERLVEELQPERSMGHNPVFQAFFALHNMQGEELRLPGLTIESVGSEDAIANFDLSLFVTRREAGLEGALVYATDLFDAATIERMAGHLEVLLEAAAAHPDARLSALPVLTDAERETLLREWSGAGESFPVADSLHGRFEARAAARPDAVAVTFDGQSLTYGQLNARANRLARRLRALGVAPESRVGLCTERSLELVVGVLAILKAGAAYVPLDPAYPADRLSYMAEDSGIRVLLAQSALAGRVAVEGVQVVALEDDVADEIGEDLGISVHPSSLAYVIYTSGSTGRPKGVGVTHGNVLRLFDSTQSGFGFSEKDVWTLFHSYAFDFSVWEIWGALLYGGRLVVVPFDISRDPIAFRALLERERVTSLSQTPSAFKALAKVDEDSLTELSHLRIVVFGGEALQYESLRTWLERYGPKRPRLVNMYGITETTVHVTWHTVTGAELKPGAVGSGVGTPIPDLRAYVLNAAGQPQPAGVPGELYVGGAGLARGYLGRPGLTAQRFVPDPFSGDEGARLYRSGDLARWRVDGTLEYLGRIDQQVKVRGFRIELGEIESVLLAQPGVSAAAVIVRGEGEEAALVAYIVPGEEAPSAVALRDALRAQLPDYMVPAAIVSIDRIPLTANGKLDRRALPEPDAAGMESGDGWVAPRTPTEEVLAGLWAEVLKAERVGATDNFFDLGGHSLLATQVMARIREVFGVHVPLRTLFESPTIAQLAEQVEALRKAGAPVLPPVVAVPRTETMPLSFAQERLWFLQRLQPESTTYNHPTALRLRGALDAAALERALGETVRRHESLRTTFPERDGAPVQVIAPFAGFALPVIDLSHLPAEERQAEVMRRADAEAERVFDLAAGPLFIPALLRLDAQEHVLILSMHHIVTDGWSMGVLFRDLSTLYETYRNGEESVLPPLEIQYADYAVWQREQLRGEALEREIGFWREQLAGAPALLEVPTDHPRGPLQAQNGGREGIELSAELLDRLRALGRREGATLYMVLLGAFQVLLGKYAGTDDVVVGSPIAGRTQRQAEELIGFFVNTLVLRTDLGGDPAFREVLRRVRETTLGAWQHQEVPFERLVEALQPERSLSHSPLFQVMFALVTAAERERNAIAGLQAEPVSAASATTKFDLNLAFVEQADGLRAVLEYSANLFEPATIQRMLAHLARVLEQVAKDADLPLSKIELLDDAEREQVVTGCNATDRAYPIAPVHALFAEQARRTPDATALLHAGRSMTYAALDRRAEAVARRLREMGVGPETMVGLCMERTPELLAAVLGIWKAGGAYVPLDPDYPADRLAWMVSDARLPVIVAAGSGADALSHRHGAVLRADLLPEDDGQHPAVDVPVSADGLAYVIYTSGSTGRPKGVLVQHGSLANLLAATRETFGVREDDVMPALASYSFDIWLFETLLPLTSGAAVRLLDRERVLDVPSMMDEAADATLLHAVPALMRQVAQVQRESGRLTRIRRLFVGGDLVPSDLLAEMADALPEAETHVLYGPTEGTILASAHPVPEDGIVEAHPIGTPFGNVRIHVCDAAGNPQPAGLPGELLIGGAGVGRGYLHRPALTAERFVPDPFGPAGSRLYRTGDRVRRRADGSLEYLGRLDGQVKVRGFRVEPGEIEAALRRHEGVRECVVVARGEGAERRLVAYVAGDADGESLKRHLRQDLPDYMVPGAFVVMDALPVTPNGKLDRRALPAPEQPAGAEAAPPRDALEQAVAQVWAEVLGNDRIGVHDNFFDLGGTSLLLYRVYSRLRELRADLRVVDLFRYTTVEELAAYLGADAADDGAELAESRARAQERRARRRVRG